MATYQYDLRQIHLSLFGVPILAGGGTDGFITINMPKFHESRDGVHGDGVVFRTANSTATFSVSLLQSSEYNEVLTGIMNTAKLDVLTNGEGTFSLKNIKTGETIVGQCVLDGYPSTVDYGADVATRVWEGRLLDAQITFAARAAL